MDRTRGSGLAVALAVAGAFLAAGVAIPVAAGQGQQEVRVSSTGLGAERIKTVPIASKSGAKRRVVISLPPTELGQVRPGDVVWGGGEVEFSVTCLEPMPQCVGTRYDYSPKVKARIVLANGPTATGEGTLPIGDIRRQRCSQEHPHRNHHCVIALSGRRAIEAGDLRCGRCHMNLVLDVYHPSARTGNVVVVGSDGDDGISQNKGMLNGAVFHPGPPPPVEPRVTTKRETRRVPVGAPGNGPGKEGRVIASQRVDALRAGEQLLIEASARVKTGHLPYTTLLQSQIVLSQRPGSTGRKGIPRRVTAHAGVINPQNGFNCTSGRSGHQSPCPIRKVAVVRVTKDARTKPERGLGPLVPLYVNLVVQGTAQYNGHRHRSGDVAKVKRDLSLEVTRYGAEYAR